MTWTTVSSMVVLAVVVSACGEKPQTSGTRKADQAPYATATGAYTAGTWKEGDAAAWEKQLNSRAQNGQNEYSRATTP
jgi:hypothetical protein